MRRGLVVVMVVVAAGCSKKSDKFESTNWCADELTKTIAPQLEQTLDGGDADAFHRATDKFTQGTMCGPDFASVVHDWEQSLRDPDAAKGTAQRHALVARLGD